MEQSKYFMSAKKKLSDSSPHIFAPPPPPSNLYGDSWEEQAFAEDAAGILGGCVWPPRSYSCSFCRREFRSAQALGGHMNVHRRDRAILKQSSPNDSPKADKVELPPNHALNPCTVSFDHHASNYPYSSSTFLYNNHPDFQDIIRVSSPPPTNIEEKTKSTLSFFSPIVHKQDVNNMNTSWSSFVATKRDRRVLDLIENDEENKSSTEKEDCVTEDHVSVSQKYPKGPNDGEIASFKRRRIDANLLSFLPKLSSTERCNVSGSVEELDLELRLGDAPKVK